MISLKFTPFDIACFIRTENFTYSHKNEIIRILFDKYNEEIEEVFSKDYMIFKREIMNYIVNFETAYEELNIARIIMDEVSKGREQVLKEELNRYDVFLSYFKLVKLQIIFSEQRIKRLKLRTLLCDFGYKRRTQEVVEIIEIVIRKLGMKVYLKGNKECKISKITIDDMIIIRNASVKPID